MLRYTAVASVGNVPFDSAHPVTTPNTLNTLNTASVGVRRALADAVERMAALLVPLTAPLSAAQFTDIGGSDVAVPGCGGGEGCYTSSTTRTTARSTTTAGSRRSSSAPASSWSRTCPRTGRRHARS